MKAILTKCVSCSNTKPTRIKAYTEGGNSIMVSWSECDGNGDRTQGQAHMYAARKLCNKMKWEGKLIGGGTPTGYCFVFQNSLIKE